MAEFERDGTKALKRRKPYGGSLCVRVRVCVRTIALTSYHEERYWIITQDVTQTATEPWVRLVCVCVSIFSLPFSL